MFFIISIVIFSNILLERPKNIKLKLAQIESTIYLRNQLLRDSDWASMYHGVELRTPYVDVTLLKNLKNVICYLPFFYSKAPLISCLEKKLPRSILFKRKIGFQTPYKKWMHDLNRNNAKTTGLTGWMNFVSNIY